MDQIGQWLIGAGVVICIVGGIFLLIGRVSWLGRLPGDILIEREHFKLFIPITTMLIVSLILTIIANIIARIWR